jgi:hypothetical protein
MRAKHREQEDDMLQRFGETLPEREVKFAPCDLKSVEADGTFTGYASLFNEVELGQAGRGGSSCSFSTTRTSRSGCGSSSPRMPAGCSRAGG